MCSSPTDPIELDIQQAWDDDYVRYLGDKPDSASASGR